MSLKLEEASVSCLMQAGRTLVIYCGSTACSSTASSSTKSRDTRQVLSFVATRSTALSVGSYDMKYIQVIEEPFACA